MESERERERKREREREREGERERERESERERERGGETERERQGEREPEVDKVSWHMHIPLLVGILAGILIQRVSASAKTKQCVSMNSETLSLHELPS